MVVGEIVEIGGRCYEVVSDRTGGVTLEPPITPAAELHAERGTKPASADDFKRLAGDTPCDDEDQTGLRTRLSLVSSGRASKRLGASNASRAVDEAQAESTLSEQEATTIAYEEVHALRRSTYRGR